MHKPELTGQSRATRSVEDYIKAIYHLSAESTDATTRNLAGRLAVSGPAVSKMLRRLTAMGLIEHERGRPVRLSSTGRLMALEMVRHHRLLELYLVEALGYGWDTVHDEAERLEHHISEEFENRIDALLGHPTFCPHGDPIPDSNLSIAAAAGRALSQVRPPAELTVIRVSDKSAALLKYVAGLGLVPGAALRLVEQEPFGGSFVVEVGGKVARLAPSVADAITVSAR
ncbi:MAG: metal-dependent transcriptional regulator [Armatimonadetes bacterium]|nr:metal-dependent transcriptional regulator [Armatimonadota bacterium]MDE2208079.1 metal-dependent transcriptional regulator [Armatimonadota bacterium]